MYVRSGSRNICTPRLAIVIREVNGAMDHVLFVILPLSWPGSRADVQPTMLHSYSRLVQRNMLFLKRRQHSWMRLTSAICISSMTCKKFNIVEAPLACDKKDKP
jgi:hypothetical protein